MRTSPVVLEKFGTSRYLSSYEESIEDTELVDAVNVIVNEFGVIQRRRGFDVTQTIIGPGSNARIISRHYTSVKNSIIIASASNLVLANDNGSGVDWTDGGFPNAQVAVQFDNQSFVFSSVTQQILRLDASGNRTSNWANVQANIAVTHKGRIFCCNNIFIPTDQLRYSQLYTDPTNPNFSGAGAWPAANIIAINQGDGERVTALAEYNDALIIFKETSTWILYTDGSPTTGWQLKKLHDSIGCTNTHSVKVIGSLLYFVSANGIFRTDGTTFEEISIPIRNVWNTYTNNNSTTMYRRSALEWDGLYMVNNEWSDNDWYIFNTKNDTWTRWIVPANLSEMVLFEEQPLRPFRALAFQTGANPVLYEMSTLSNYRDGPGTTAYESTIKFKRFDYAQPDQWKYIPTISVAFERRLSPALEATITVEAELIVDGNTDSTTSRILNLAIDDSDWNFLYQFKGPGRCRMCQLTIYTDSINDFALTKVTYHLIKSNRVGRSG